MTDPKLSDEEIEREAEKWATNSTLFKRAHLSILRTAKIESYLAGRRNSLEEITALKAENERLREALESYKSGIELFRVKFMKKFFPAFEWFPEAIEIDKRFRDGDQALHPKGTSDE